MLFLFLCILFTTAIFIVFRLFRTYRIETFQAIAVNYITASLFAYFFRNIEFDFQNLFQKDWIFLSLLLGLIFISVFTIMALTTQNFGVSVASVISKMSLVIPVTAAYFLYNDRFNGIKIAGIIMALTAVYLTNTKKEKTGIGIKTQAFAFLLPVFLFIGNGLIDTLLKYSQEFYVPKADREFFISSSFGSAALIGIISLIYRKFAKQKRFRLQSIYGGVPLGIINFFSLYFLLKALETPEIESSVVFPVLNVGIVFLSTVLGLILFKETLTTKNKIGIALAILAIIFIAQSEMLINYVTSAP